MPSGTRDSGTAMCVKRQRARWRRALLCSRNEHPRVDLPALQRADSERDVRACFTAEPDAARCCCALGCCTHGSGGCAVGVVLPAGRSSCEELGYGPASKYARRWGCSLAVGRGVLAPRCGAGRRLAVRRSRAPSRDAWDVAPAAVCISGLPHAASRLRARSPAASDCAVRARAAPSEGRTSSAMRRPRPKIAAAQ